MEGSERWNPWRELRRRSEVQLWFSPLDGRRGMWMRDCDTSSADGRGDLIVLDPELGRTARRCVLAHELIHVERGVGYGAATDATMQREEEIVRREVARRLVPMADLCDFLRTRGEVGPVLIEDVSDEFDVEADVATKAVAILQLDRFGAP